MGPNCLYTLSCRAETCRHLAYLGCPARPHMHANVYGPPPTPAGLEACDARWESGLQPLLTTLAPSPAECAAAGGTAAVAAWLSGTSCSAAQLERRACFKDACDVWCGMAGAVNAGGRGAVGVVAMRVPSPCTLPPALRWMPSLHHTPLLHSIGFLRPMSHAYYQLFQSSTHWQHSLWLVLRFCETRFPVVFILLPPPPPPVRSTTSPPSPSLSRSRRSPSPPHRAAAGQPWHSGRPHPEQRQPQLQLRVHRNHHLCNRNVGGDRRRAAGDCGPADPPPDQKDARQVADRSAGRLLHRERQECGAQRGWG